MFWCDYSLLPVLAGCQNTHHRGVMNWVDGWQTLKGVRQQLKDLKEYSHSDIYFQVSKSFKQRYAKQNHCFVRFCSAFLATMCLRFEGDYNLARKRWGRERERETEPVTVIEHWTLDVCSQTSPPCTTSQLLPDSQNHPHVEANCSKHLKAISKQLGI